MEGKQIQPNGQIESSKRANVLQIQRPVIIIIHVIHIPSN